MRKTIKGGLSAALALLALALASAPAQAETTVLVSNAENSLCVEPTEFKPGTEAKKNFKPLTKKHKGPFPESAENCAPGTANHATAMGAPGQPAAPYSQSISGAEWVSTNASGASGKVPAYYIYNTTFNLECPNQAENAKVTIHLLADNTAGAFMNGVPIGNLAFNLPPSNHENFNTPGGKVLGPAGGGFKVGLNVLQFVVYDESAPFTALNFSAEITYPPCEIRWYSNGKLLEPGVREHVMTSGTISSTTHFGETTTKTKCKVADEEIIENPAKGGNGVDEMTTYTLTGCKAAPSPCPGKEAFEIKALGLPWQTHLIAGPPIRDVIEGIELETLCGGKPLAVFSGTLSPAVGNSMLEFGAGSGELEGPGGAKTSFTGKDKLKGPPGDEKITAH